jgi:hypothetical protein
LDDGICISGLSVDPLNYDFLEFEAKFVGGAAKRNVRVSWAPANRQFSQELLHRNCAAVTVSDSGHVQHVCVNLSHVWRWFTSGSIGKLLVCPDAAERVEIRDIRLVPAQLVAPGLASPLCRENNSGIVEISGKSVALETDTRSVPNAAKAVIQVSNPNCFFDNFEIGEAPTAVSKTIESGSAIHRLTISGSEFSTTFPSSGFYQLRARCVDNNGRHIL